MSGTACWHDQGRLQRGSAGLRGTLPGQKVRLIRWHNADTEQAGHSIRVRPNPVPNLEVKPGVAIVLLRCESPWEAIVLASLYSLWASAWIHMQIGAWLIRDSALFVVPGDWHAPPVGPAGSGAAEPGCRKAPHRPIFGGPGRYGHGSVICLGADPCIRANPRARPGRRPCLGRLKLLKLPLRRCPHAGVFCLRCSA